MLNRNNVIKILLAVAIFSIMSAIAVSAAGEGNQFVEHAIGTKERVYPVITTANPGECGTDTCQSLEKLNRFLVKVKEGYLIKLAVNF